MLARAVSKSRSFAEADRHDMEQHRALSPAERFQAANTLKVRIYGPNRPDVRHGRHVQILKRK